MRPATRKCLEDLTLTYDRFIQVMEPGAARAVERDGRAYGGFVRAAKGKLQEHITESLVRIAWEQELQRPPGRMDINSKKIPIPMVRRYLDSLPTKAVRDFMATHIRRCHYKLSVDRHVFVDGRFVLAVECKAYTENAMLKRILVDFHLLKTKYPELRCYLFQLESQLGGDYATNISSPMGSFPTHTLMSYFSEVNLCIVTLLDGERKVDRPINKPTFFKPLPRERLERAVAALVEGLENH